ncbi:ATP-binding protein [Embleya hyalina]|uniref:ATP-binding protein n=1 Tax=Embleya hyalina TaxID=516124 RepID=UPI00135A2991|nr:ATP-binding protein [Embleya hyalina]
MRRHMFAIPAIESRVADARRRTVRVLTSWGLRRHDEETVRLVASELITNAVSHAGHLTPFVTVLLELDGVGRLRIGVRDCHPGPPLSSGSCDDEDVDGRGLMIVEALLEEYDGGITIEWHDPGKTVWAVFGPPARMAPSVAIPRQRQVRLG